MVKLARTPEEKAKDLLESELIQKRLDSLVPLAVKKKMECRGGSGWDAAPK